MKITDDMLTEVEPIVSQWIRERGTCMDGASYAAALELAAYVAARRTTPDREAIKDDYMLVPIKPDRVMLDRAVSLAMNVKISACYRWADYMRDLWAAFLEVAPAAAPDRTVAASSYCDVHCKTFCQNSVHGMCDGVPTEDKGRGA
ncbi:hypothetical protein [Burkholderia cepacia]|uniref:hypothetical protein n=1 Tax=Burkholderia cepacia TaxID=292 RepID=UPI0029901AFD|nr:hypothetical protein [Burkholderia cepacia]